MSKCVVLLMVAVAGGYGCGASPATESGPSASDSCEQVDAWIEQHREQLPSDYDAIIQFPDQYQMRIFAVLPPEVQSALWQTRFKRFPAATAEQAAVLELAADLLRPELFAASESDRGEVLGDLERHATDAFGVEGSRVLLTRLDSQDDTASVRAAASLPDCICNTQHDFCLAGKCTFGIIACKWLALGCGRAWAESCNGFCT